MEYIIAILVGLGIIWAVYYYSNKAEKEKKEERANNTASTTGKRASTVSKTSDRAQASLDQLYANSHGMWVCRYCETLNIAGVEHCAACGAQKQ